MAGLWLGTIGASIDLKEAESGLGQGCEIGTEWDTIRSCGMM